MACASIISPLPITIRNPHVGEEQLRGVLGAERGDLAGQVAEGLVLLGEDTRHITPPRLYGLRPMAA